MILRQIKLHSLIFLLSIILISSTFATTIKEIQISGNNRVSKETIKMFAGTSLNDNLEINKINKILKDIYDSNFFENVNVVFEDSILKINVVEKPVILDINYEGVKSNELINTLSEDRILKPRSSYDKISLKNDKEKILFSLRNSGYYFAKIESFVEYLGDNKININYQIDLGEKSKIKKISFIGNKIFKDKKLRNIIVSEEYKFWKFISGKKFLNQNTINFDKRLLNNFYLNKGYRNVNINSSFAKLINQNEFELIFNINANEKVFFNNIDLDIPNDFDIEVFDDVYEFFESIKGEPYSLDITHDIIEKIEIISLSEQYESTKVLVKENFDLNKLNLTFSIEDTDKYYVEKINILGNNVTVESVIRNQLLLDEGDPFNEILFTKSINQIKSLNFFKSTDSEILDGQNINSKVINIIVEEKPTGEISLGAGAGTNGATIGFAIKENNFLGKGINFSNSLTLTDKSIKGQFSVENPNYKNSDKSVNFNVQALENDKTASFGYKSNKIGFSFGTGFEYLKDVNLGLNLENFYETISTDGTASALQKTQDGNYWDTFIDFNIDYDKRNQKYDTSRGFRNYYSLKLPLVSDTGTLGNSLNYKYFTELYENNVSTASFLIKSSNSVIGKNIKLSERLFVPGSKLRGFESGKIGPKDGNDYIGGNFVSSANFTSTLPQILDNYQNMDLVLFLDAASVWGVDYSSSIDDGSSIRSSIGIGVDWFTAVGPLNFSFAHPILKEDSDSTESFRFNLGTTF
jgi:outer membrane protein insertion porin family